MEGIKEQARKEAENVWNNKLENEFTEKINESNKELLSILSSELNEFNSNINQLFEDLNNKLDEECIPKFNNNSELEQIDNNRINEIKNINNDIVDKFNLFNETKINNKNFLNKMEGNKSNNRNDVFFENNKYTIKNNNNNNNIDDNNYNKHNMNSSSIQNNMNNQSNNNNNFKNFDMYNSFNVNAMNNQNRAIYNNFNINNSNQHNNNNNFDLNVQNNNNNKNNRNNQNIMNYQNNMNNQNNMGNQNRQINNFNNMNNQNNINFMYNSNNNWKVRNDMNNLNHQNNNMNFIDNDTPNNININDNFESDELRKQKVDFSKFSNPPLITLVESNNTNQLINLIFRCLSNILTILPYYFNPNREKIILKKSREDPNGVYLGPSFLKLLDNIWKSSKKEYYPVELHTVLRKLMGINYYSNNPGFILEFILNQLDKELNFNSVVNMDNNDNDNHLNEKNSFGHFFKNFEKYSTKISNCSFSTIKTQKKCSLCQQSTYYFNSTPVVNIILESTSDNIFFNQLNLSEHLNNLLIEKKDENINEYCINCKNQRKKYVSKELFLTFSLIIFYINREKDPESRLAFNYPESFDGKKLINEVFDLYNYQLITVIKKNPNDINNYIAYCRSFINNKWYSYYKQNISVVNNINEIIDNKNACLLIYNELKSK